MGKQQTGEQYLQVMAKCRNLYEAKLKDYGTAWRILRSSSMTDQIFIKANRIRSVQIAGEQKVQEDICHEFIGIINYAIMALIQLELKNDDHLELAFDKAMSLYDKYANQAYRLMMDKNHDYGEAWRDMRTSSLVDIILMKILRVKQIEDHDGKTLVSEGLDANYLDMINYAVFALIKEN